MLTSAPAVFLFAACQKSPLPPPFGGGDRAQARPERVLDFRRKPSQSCCSHDSSPRRRPKKYGSLIVRKKALPVAAPFSVSKNHVIASQCAHWRGNPYPLQGGALRVPSAHRRPLGVVSLYERQRERIATPACGLVRDDIYILGFFYSLKGAAGGSAFLLIPV